MQVQAIIQAMQVQANRQVLDMMLSAKIAESCISLVNRLEDLPS